MKKLFYFLALMATSILTISCSRVEPNHIGVLMENYGRNGKADFSLIKGTVSTIGPGTYLYQVPLYEQRDSVDISLKLKTADNTEVTTRPSYTYSIIEDSAVNVVFNNKHLTDYSSEFIASLESNVLENIIKDVLREVSRQYLTDTLMANSGSLRFERECEDSVKAKFKAKGVTLLTFTTQIDFSNKVKDKIDVRNEVNTNLTVLDQQINEQRKRNELAKLKAEENRIISTGITRELLQQQFIEKWDGRTPLYGNTPVSNIFKAN